MMVKFYYPDGDWCYRAIQTVHAFFSQFRRQTYCAGRKGDRNGYYEFEITEFEMIGPGERHK